MSGQLDYKSTGTGVETATGHGNLAVDGLVLHELPAIRALIKATAGPDPGDVKIQTCQTDVSYDQGAFKAENLKVESQGIFEANGTLTLSRDKQVGGAIKLGFTSAYLKWLPTAETAIFTEKDGDYHVTTVHFWGDIKKPKQDLSPRIMKELEHHPLAAVSLFFNTSSKEAPPLLLLRGRALKTYKCGVRRLLSIETTTSTRNTTHRILAMDAARPARPQNPKTAATSAIMKKVIA